MRTFIKSQILILISKDEAILDITKSGSSFIKSNLIKNGVPSLVAFVILYFLGDRYVLPAVFSATDSGNMNLLIWLAIDAVMLLSTFYGTRWALFKFGLIDNWLSK